VTLYLSQKPQYYLLQWAADMLRLPSGIWTSDSRAIGVMDDGQRGEKSIRACLVLNNFTGEGCEASFVSDGSRTWARPKIIHDLLTLPFDIFGAPRIIVRISADAPETQVAALRIGFRFAATVPNYMPNGDDAVLFFLNRAPHEIDEE